MDEFIKKIVLAVTIQAAFQRGSVYTSSKLGDKDRKELKDSIKKELEKISSNYINNVSEEEHIKNITRFADRISKKHKSKLKNGKLRIGTAQKLLNVYLKFLWSLGEIKEPVHCPIDSIVLKEIKDDRKWTYLETIEEYQEIIEKIHTHIHNETIAKWEWKLWNDKA